MAHDGGKGASESLRKNIDRIIRLLDTDIVASDSPRSDFNVCFDALIEKAYREGFQKAHKLIYAEGKVRRKLPFKGKIPAWKKKQEVSFESKILK